IWNKHKQTNTPLKRKVFVGLSGGVDSSVSAMLLKKAGYDVTGVFIRVWNPPPLRSDLSPDLRSDLFGACQAADDRLDAMRVCAKLSIPFIELDLEKEYKREVVDYMIRDYSAGKTPNPDVMCNRFIKFGGFYRWAMKNGADFIATGHYARIAQVKSKKSKVKSRDDFALSTLHFQLFAGSDPQKDQSYFLWQIRKEQLPHILFPVGGTKKPEVRKLAKKFGLITAEKKDSQGLCFVGKVDMKEFLSHYIKPKKGKVLDEQGKVLGKHNGAFFYTIGERIGFFPRLNITSGKRFNLNTAGPYYVVAKDIGKNTLIVSHKTLSGELPQMQREIIIKDCNWFTIPKNGKWYGARVRYRQPLQHCTLHVKSSKVIFEKPQTVAAGQSLVLYAGDTLIGGGITV
ncbi:MAG: tRNA 2-thiouridine(34) synthase MnmA, partial [Patescibacteria group bacterium]